MKRRQFIKGSALAAGSLIAMPAILRAQGAAEFSFFFPVAVGGPITKLIDKYAQDFEAEHSGMKVKPIYAGTYQETIVKALTAHKAGAAPATTCDGRPLHGRRGGRTRRVRASSSRVGLA